MAAKVTALDLTGINLVPEAQRVQPDGQLAMPVVGTVNWAGAGASGFEYEYQSLLAGKSGTKSLLEAPDGATLPGTGMASVPARPGTGLELTIDESVQYVAEQALAAEISASHAYSGTAVVMDVKTGDILAMADLQSTTGSPTTGAAPDPRPRRRPRSGHHPSGASSAPESTSGPTLVARPTRFRPVSRRRRRTPPSPRSTSRVGVQAGHLLGRPGRRHRPRPTNAIKCRRRSPWARTPSTTPKSHGTEHLTASQILAQSSNIGTIEVAEGLGESRLLAQIANLGFGKPTGLGFPGESEGLVPGADAWTGTSIGSTPIGQDDAVTAQQILDAYNAVANGGVFVAPRLVRGTISPSGTMTAAQPSPSHRVISPTTNAQLVQMLEGVVTQGTGTEAAIDGYTVAGKTGTAQIPDPSHLGYISGAYVGIVRRLRPGPEPGPLRRGGPRPPHAHLRWCGGRPRVLHDHGLCPAPLRHPHHRRGRHGRLQLAAVGSTGTISVPPGAVTEGP